MHLLQSQRRELYKGAFPHVLAVGTLPPLDSVKKQLKQQQGGAANARLLCVVELSASKNLTFRPPNERDRKAVVEAVQELNRRRSTYEQDDLIPIEDTTGYHTFVNRGPLYGMTKWEHYFTPRQLLTLSTFVKAIREVGTEAAEAEGQDFGEAIQTLLTFVLGKCLDYCNSVVSWMPRGTVGHLFARQAIPITWDFPEANPLGSFHCSWQQALDWVSAACSGLQAATKDRSGHAQQCSATSIALPDDCVDVLFTDPPYYYSVQYADLSDFFYVWLRRALKGRHGTLLATTLTPKDEEIIVQSPGHQFAPTGKNKHFFESEMAKAMNDCRRVLKPNGVGVVVFAHTSTAGWEAQLQAMIDAGWVITASWPIDTERAARSLAQNRAVLASSVHLVCRPREYPDGSIQTGFVGDWREVLDDLREKIKQWLPRLAAEGVVGADAIFSCLGPALEVFSKYSSVERASGEKVSLRDYLEEVWSVVSKEALTEIFKEADASSLEPDARLTAMWLWTVSPGSQTDSEPSNTEPEESETAAADAVATLNGITLEYDAARKIAQGLGVHLEKASSIVEIEKDEARLLPVAERARFLFGKETPARDSTERLKGKRKAQVRQINMFPNLERQASLALESGNASNKSGGDIPVPELDFTPGKTVLDRLHQAMILFADGRGGALRKLLAEDGVGKDPRVWKLAQSLSALYPAGSDEKRWVDGVLARKKSLGF